MAAKALFDFITEYYDHWQAYPSLQNIWDAATEAAEALKPTDNSDYAAALDVVTEFFKEGDVSSQEKFVTFLVWLRERLHAPKAHNA